MMKINILTLFPEFLNSFLNFSIIKKAQEKNLITINVLDIRNFSNLKHNQIDDTPYGGGSGMVLMVEPVLKAIKSVKNDNSIIILLSPQGNVWNQEKAKSFSNLNKDLIIICGHYEGFDERIRNYIDIEISIGDYILTGGETASMILTESIVRLIPNVIKEDSHINDSFSKGLLDYPVYTKPYCYDYNKVPDVLVNGNHKLINEWREYHALKNTFKKRRDLLKKIKLSDKQKKYLEEIKMEVERKNKNV